MSDLRLVSEFGSSPPTATTTTTPTISPELFAKCVSTIQEVTEILMGTIRHAPSDEVAFDAAKRVAWMLFEARLNKGTTGGSE